MKKGEIKFYSFQSQSQFLLNIENLNLICILKYFTLICNIILNNKKMKKIFTLLMLVAVTFANAQAFKGKGDVKAQVGATFQNGANGIQVSADFGIGENMSYGFVGSYLLGFGDLPAGYSVPFKDRADIKARFNANIGKVLTLGDEVDIYPGLNLGTKAFGAHLGGRYFFSDGFGLFTELGFPIASYESANNGGFNDQFVFVIGASFNL